MFITVGKLVLSIYISSYISSFFCLFVDIVQSVFAGPFKYTIIRRLSKNAKKYSERRNGKDLRYSNA